MKLKALVPLVFFSGTILAQGPTGEITGLVTDASGAVTAGAKVTVKNVSTDIERSLITNEAGVYTAPALSPGTYSVTINLTGFPF
jgi:hypothetical protein